MTRALGAILILLAVILMALGCASKEITSQDVMGTYVANYDKKDVVSDFIEVRSNGTYTHDFKSPDEKKNFTNTGTWNFGYMDGVPRLNFQNFMIGFSPYSKHFPDDEEKLKRTWGGTWSPPVEDDGERLLIDDDLGLHYDKQ